MRKIAFYLAHPAHYHLFKNTINELADGTSSILVLYNEKDVLHSLVMNLNNEHVKIKKIPTIAIIKTKSDLTLQFIQKLCGAFLNLLFFRPTLVLGTPVLISLVGNFLGFKSIIVNEDDFDIVQKTADLGYPYATTILCPTVCRTGKFHGKCVKYLGYHELAYLHPNNFSPSFSILEKYSIPTDKPYAIIRFAKLMAHHDERIRGIDVGLALRIVKLLTLHMRIYITTERPLEAVLENNRIAIDPIDMHHVMAFADLYIGDSQTMAAEAGVLGVPFIRYNDFVGRISYLDELEKRFQLGYGISPNNPEELFQKVKNLITMPNRKHIFQQRRQAMLDEKIDTAKFMTWFVKEYPRSVTLMRQDSDFQSKFK